MSLLPAWPFPTQLNPLSAAVALAVWLLAWGGLIYLAVLWSRLWTPPKPR